MSVVGSVGQIGYLSDERSSVPIQAANLAKPKLRLDILLEFVITIVVLPPTFYFVHPSLGGYTFVFLTVLMYTYHTLRGEPYALFCLIVAGSPLLALLRGSFMPFDTPSVLLFCSLAWSCVIAGPSKELLKRKDLIGLIVFCVVYWIFSWLRTQDYANNIRALELGFSTAMVFVLSERRSYLATALVGVGLSVITEGMMLAPYGDRLGLGVVPGMDTGLGNPILLGIPAAFVCLLCLCERGRWLLLEDHPYWRALLGGGCAVCLLFSTSRGSWLLAIVGIVILACTDQKARGPIAASLLAMTFFIISLVNTPMFEAVKHYYDNATSSETSIEKKTTGRSEQWKALPQILEDYPLLGVGPGFGRAASKEYSNKGIIFHSLYLQIGAELGLLGLTTLFFFIAVLMRRAYRHLKAYKELAPLLGLVGFLLMGLSVSAIDMSGGLLLGIGMMGGTSVNLWRIRQQSIGTIRDLS